LQWAVEDDISNYHSFTIPYGEKFHARRIEKLLYTKDLLLNAEWNTTERTVNLHRHPAFFGDAEDVFEDCCGNCPKPSTLEEKKIAEEESKNFVSGKYLFLPMILAVKKSAASTLSLIQIGVRWDTFSLPRNCVRQLPIATLRW
jgi:hypothetical protein